MKNVALHFLYYLYCPLVGMTQTYIDHQNTIRAVLGSGLMINPP